MKTCLVLNQLGVVHLSQFFLTPAHDCEHLGKALIPDSFDHDYSQLQIYGSFLEKDH